MFRKEDFVFNARIEEHGVEVEKDVLCRVYLPVKIDDPLELRFHLSEQQAEKLRMPVLWQYSVTGDVKNFSGEIRMKFSANEVISTGVQTKFHGRDIRESEMVGSPMDFTITHFLTPDPNETNNAKVEGNFWLTPNPLFQPAAIIKNSYTGDVEVETVWSFDFELDSSTNLHFREHYRYTKNEDGDTVSFGELVASFALEDSTADGPQIPENLERLDDVLLLASFAARRRSICLGWDATDSRIYVKRYIRNRTIPDQSRSKGTWREGIVEKSQFADFMKTAYAAFVAITPNDPLRRAIGLAVPIKDSTLDSEFVTLYTALEMLVLQFRRQQDLEFIFPQSNKWKKINRGLKNYIDEMELPETDNSKRQLIKDKLSELNRISFNAAFERFCAHYSVRLEDLWPVASKQGGISLSQIRNKLVHGEPFSQSHYDALMFATLHLQWTVERMILAILKWGDVEESNVSSRFLSGWIAYKEWQSKRLLFA